MKRDEAVAFLKEITNTCGSMSPDSVTLLHSMDDLGYQVHIKTVSIVKLNSRCEILLKNTA